MVNVSNDESNVLLREILDNQKEALDLNGQLVLLNEKMDKLIDCVDKKMQPSSTVNAVLSNTHALSSIVFIILVALFLGLGDGIMERWLGPGEVDDESIEKIIRVLEKASQSAASSGPSE
tara:strand:- start:266 stop:625 length:360 start_codon:yes stop_codon:yes gene_type:complete